MRYKSTSIKSKWVKTKWLLKRNDLSKYVPHTTLFSKSSLRSLLSRYSMVFFKPTDGSGGFNIIRIKKMGNGYQTQHNTVKTHYSTIEGLYKGLNKRAKKRSYLLQMGINLARTNGKPFDIRVMVQKPDRGDWISTVIFTKIGRIGKVATNYNQGGQIGFLQQTLSGAGYNSSKTKQKETELKNLGVSVGRQFDRQIRGFRELGLDVALDKSGRAWILEVNTRPQFYPLKNMSDTSAYHRIMSYAKQYGRKR